MKLASAAVLLAALAAAPAFAQGTPAGTAGTVTVSDPWSRATAPGAANGACFLVATNTGGEADRLVSAASPVAQKVELHTHRMEDGVMKMRPVEAIEVKPGEPAVLKPGGNHVMLMGLKEQLKPGTRFPVTLTFARGGSVTVEVPVQEAGAMGPGGMAHGGAGHGGAGHGHQPGMKH